MCPFVQSFQFFFHARHNLACILLAPQRYGEVHHSEESQGLAPGFEEGEGIGADNEEKIMPPAGALGQFGQSVNGVGNSSPLDLDRIAHEMGEFLQGQMHHLQPILGRSNIVRGFVGGKREGDDPHLIQIERLSHFIRRAQMPVMNRVESSS